MGKNNNSPDKGILAILFTVSVLTLGLIIIALGVVFQLIEF
jgi:hypothetical protein